MVDNIKEVEYTYIRSVKIALRYGRSGELDALITNTLGDGWGGDYIIFSLNCDEEVFKQDFGDSTSPQVDYHYIVYKHNEHKWCKIYEGSEYPEAVGACI